MWTALSFRSRYEVIRALWDRTATTGGDERSFDEWCMLRFDAYASLMSIALLVPTMTMAIVERVRDEQGEIPGLPGLAAAFAIANTVLAITSLIYLLMPRTPLVMRYLLLFYGATSGLALHLGLTPLAALGGPDAPYIYLALSFPLWTIHLPMRLPSRTALVSWWCVGIVATIFGPQPHYWQSPWAVQYCKNLGITGVMGIALGHFVQALHRKTFLQSQALTRRGQVLQETVAERSREVRQLVSHVQTAQEVERSRIARDLHDDLGQELTALHYAVEWTQRRFITEPAMIGPNLTQLGEQLRRATASLQATIGELRPRIVEELGFIAAAQWLARQVSERASLECEVVTSGTDEHLDGKIGAAAFRILQEALTNVVKHAAATRVLITITIDQTALELAVVDDGQGLKSAASSLTADRPGGGLGFLSMRERCTELGGALTISNVQDATKSGVEVVCRIPIRPSVQGRN